MDKYGNLTDRSEFDKDVLIRLVSYLDPDVALGVHASRPGWDMNDIEGSMTRCRTLNSSVGVHKISAGDPTFTSMLRASRRDGETFTLAWENDPFIALNTEYGGKPFLYWPSGDKYEAKGKQMLLSNPMEQGEGANMVQNGFTIDFVDGVWFALNNPDHSLVADITESRTAESTAIVAFPWNGGQNQIWRAQTVSYYS